MPACSDWCASRGDSSYLVLKSQVHLHRHGIDNPVHAEVALLYSVNLGGRVAHVNVVKTELLHRLSSSAFCCYLILLSHIMLSGND